MLLLYDHPTAGKIEAADHLISPDTVNNREVPAQFASI
jgi:hypothetical protein